MYLVETPAEPTKEAERILLVDDNSTNLQVLLQTLSGRGYKLLIAKNGENALKIVAKARPALVLLDILVPGMDGYEVCRQLQENPDTHKITVIFLSALDDAKDKVRGLEAGAVDFISKPFQAEEVIARVETQLKIHKLERALSARNRQLEADKVRILENMNEGIFGLDNQGRITFANSNSMAATMTGWSVDQLSNVSLLETLLGDGRDDPERSKHFAPIQVSLNKGVTKEVEDGLFWHNKGASFPVDYSCTPIMQDGQPNGAVVVFFWSSQSYQLIRRNWPPFMKYAG